jgi:DNA-binding GntR family transcriptional regulator
VSARGLEHSEAPKPEGPEALYTYLRELILSGAIAPGSPISQVALARELGVSRTPLRESMRRLQQEGLIEAEHNQRARVTGFDPDDVELVYCNRLMGESLGIALTVTHLQPGDLDIMATAIEEMHERAGADDEAGYAVAHRRFHMALVMHADERMQQSIASYVDRGERYRRLYRLCLPGAGGFGASEHDTIFQACQDRDRPAAVAALARHLSHNAVALLARMAPERDSVPIRTALNLITGLAPKSEEQQ